MGEPGDAGKGFSSAAALGLPRLVGRRVLLKLAARGGMGDVYLGATTGLEGAERPCIVKTVRRDHVHDGSFLARFLDEARVQAQLQHPGVAQVLEAATDSNGEPYTVVEFVEGRALSDVRQRSVQAGVRIGWPDAVAIAIEIAQALAHVHERAGGDGEPLGIVHRDLSPQNVMVGYAGEIKLIDFGTARGHNRRCHTVAGVVFAKPGYVAPEVARQQVGDGRIDVYALGIVLWELCAGRRFLTTDPQAHLDDAAAGRVVVPPVASLCNGPKELDEVISRLTKNDPDERYPRAAAAAADLARLLSSAPADGGERGVRGRVAALMRKLWPNEPTRSRAEFARLLREAREMLQESANPATPQAGPVSEAVAVRSAPSDPQALAGTPYRLGRKLGEGANGTVYEAEHVELGRKVAVKILSPEHGTSPTAFDRFRREARIIGRLSHPNLVQLYDFGKSLDGRAFLAMELCAGETLDARLRRGPLPWLQAVRIAIATAQALETAHAAGLVHRDIKPQNLMLSGTGAEPKIKLLDFGIATALTPERRSATAGERSLRGFAIVGTPEYMAPEQVADDAVDRRTDLYALGCVLYEMLTGVRAFDGPGTVVVLGKQLRETPLPPRARAPSLPIPAAVDAVVVRAMAKQPGARFPTALEMIEALEATLHAPERRREHVRRVAAGVLSAAAMVAAAVGASQWERWRIAEGTPAAHAHAEQAHAGAVDANAAIAPPPAVAAAIPANAARADRADRSDMPSLALPGLAMTTTARAESEAPPPSPSLRDAPHDRGEHVDRDAHVDRGGHGDGESTTSHEARRKLGRWNKSQDASRSGKLP
jgi:serine/threonine protein kinase